MKTKVTVIFFKTSGKYNITEKFETDIETFEGNKIIDLIKKNYPTAKHNNFTVEVERGLAWNKWLVLI